MGASILYFLQHTSTWGSSGSQPSAHTCVTSVLAVTITCFRSERCCPSDLSAGQFGGESDVLDVAEAGAELAVNELIMWTHERPRIGHVPCTRPMRACKNPMRACMRPMRVHASYARVHASYARMHAFSSRLSAGQFGGASNVLDVAMCYRCEPGAGRARCEWAYDVD